MHPSTGGYGIDICFKFKAESKLGNSHSETDCREINNNRTGVSHATVL